MVASGKQRTLGAGSGRMPTHFLEGVEAAGAPIIERDISARLEEVVIKKAEKMGC